MAPDRDTLRSAWRDERARLCRLADDLQVRFDDIVAGAELTSTDDEHDPEGATIAYERAQVWALLQQARADLHSVDDALAGLELGELPTCASCHGPIATERLLALPGVRTCIDCARRPVP
ncbi:MAG: TraR/DksA C4-type zinc finger protein [Acidimicrobiales bacterium]